MENNKKIDTQMPVIDHIDMVANIALKTYKDKEFTISPNENITQQFICFINHGDKTVLKIDDKQYIEIPKGFSAIYLNEITINKDKIELSLPSDSDCEYCVVGRFV